MANKRSDLSTFPSKYSKGKWITPAQYIVELVCEQSASYQNKDLPQQFWKDDEWATFFKSQTRTVNRLVQKYDSKIIIKVVKTKRIRSLLPKWVEKIIKQEQRQSDSAARAEKIWNNGKPKHQKRDIIKAKRPKFVSKFDKLLAYDEALDGEKESR